MATGAARRGGWRIAKQFSERLTLSSSLGVQNGGGSVGMQGLGATNEVAPFGARAASNQAVRNRMRSVKNIQKITMAMKMVAASKLRTVQVKAENSRGLFQPFTALLGDAPAVMGNKTLVVTLSTDKGLCGGINSTVVKYSRSLMKLNQLHGEGYDTKFVIVGDKGKAQLQREYKKLISTYITETQKVAINFTQCAMIADEIIKSCEYDVIKVVYNKFNSAVSFLPTVATLLSPEMLAGEEAQKIGNLESYETEGAETQGEVLQNLAEFQLASVLYNAMLENATSEMGARMSAMDSSTRNAGEVLDRLTLSYNRSRQASITTELIEIISGAAALEG
ncbi:ATP synthase subunit gamma, mitochondrial [Physcomitrium patens]|uniref:F-ATPase gamma subunit n=1 Tax=Physcomitrium patens TaxID=3218 RepID=A0A2K1J0D5_PHYPA|nr:ATP synthase subunit gamma, mitochondrial-like [Physcomitrium patens]PNR34992.1 hypothetical protein PHYPA_022891 [Physcomitrium patens]|eukprot:XP_024402033.1 ATP synthase subunit gamma, mitochondrial-like [Physcomitrella patens]